MAVLNDYLSVWEIGFRWAGRDPSRWVLRLPLEVRDNFRTLVDAILQGHLYCAKLGLEKDAPIYAEAPELSIRNWLGDVNEAIEGKSFNRRLLRWALIDRWAMHQWCERRGIPLPEFWFPSGWNLDYEWQEPGATAATDAGADLQAVEQLAERPVPSEAAPPHQDKHLAREPSIASLRNSHAAQRTLDRRQRGKIACQEVARRLWQKQPTALKKDHRGKSRGSGSGSWL